MKSIERITLACEILITLSFLIQFLSDRNDYLALTMTIFGIISIIVSFFLLGKKR